MRFSTSVNLSFEGAKQSVICGRNYLGLNRSGHGKAKRHSPTNAHVAGDVDTECNLCTAP